MLKLLAFNGDISNPRKERKAPISNVQFTGRSENKSSTTHPITKAKDAFQKQVSESTAGSDKVVFKLFKLQETEGLSDVEKNTRDVILNWCKNFLSKPHPELGHPNAQRTVCPFTPRALRSNTLLLAVDPNPNPDPKKTAAALKKLSANFDKIQPSREKLKTITSIIIAYPNLPLDKTATVIDGVQHQVKPDFVQKGLMIGEFHEANNNPGAYNPNFHPFQTPVPSFNIRPMVAEDLHFLTNQKYSPEDRIRFIKSYMAQNFRTNKNAALFELHQAKVDKAYIDLLNETYQNGIAKDWEKSLYKTLSGLMLYPFDALKGNRSSSIQTGIRPWSTENLQSGPL